MVLDLEELKICWDFSVVSVDVEIERCFLRGSCFLRYLGIVVESLFWRLILREDFEVFKKLIWDVVIEDFCRLFGDLEWLLSKYIFEDLFWLDLFYVGICGIMSIVRGYVFIRGYVKDMVMVFVIVLGNEKVYGYIYNINDVKNVIFNGIVKVSVIVDGFFVFWIV